MQPASRLAVRDKKNLIDARASTNLAHPCSTRKAALPRTVLERNPRLGLPCPGLLSADKQTEINPPKAELSSSIPLGFLAGTGKSESGRAHNPCQMRLSNCMPKKRPLANRANRIGRPALSSCLAILRNEWAADHCRNRAVRANVAVSDTRIYFISTSDLECRMDFGIKAVFGLLFGAGELVVVGYWLQERVAAQLRSIE